MGIIEVSQMHKAWSWRAAGRAGFPKRRLFGKLKRLIAQLRLLARLVVPKLVSDFGAKRRDSRPRGHAGPGSRGAGLHCGSLFIPSNSPEEPSSLGSVCTVSRGTKMHFLFPIKAHNSQPKLFSLCMSPSNPHMHTVYGTLHPSINKKKKLSQNNRASSRKLAMSSLPLAKEPYVLRA